MSKISVFILSILVAIAWCMPTAEEENSAPTGYCEYKGLHIKEGETVPAPIGECNKVTCKNATNPRIIKLTCAQFRPAPGCHKSEKDLTKPYPACCPKSVCDEEEEEIERLEVEEEEVERD